jgi:hypothetical protein
LHFSGSAAWRLCKQKAPEELNKIIYLYGSRDNPQIKKYKKMRRILLVISFLVVSGQLSLFSQQLADTSYNPLILHPEYSPGKGSLVVIDEGHNNYHTLEGRYLPFARLLRQDGYVVNGYNGIIDLSRLNKVRILVIANALNKINVFHWYLPTPSAFSPREIETLKKWVDSGGSLFLIADHMPMGGAAADLAAAFGFRFTNGFAIDTTKGGTAFFYRSDNSLSSNIITNGRDSAERVNKAVTFTGQAFRFPDEAIPILRFDKRYTLLETDTAWVFDSTTKFIPLDSTWSQGAFMDYGKGRLVMFGEAAMFTAQLAGPQQGRIGMNSSFAEENYKLLLNIIHWLDRRY